MDVLVVNCGSSSIKYQLFDTAADEVIAKGVVERIGADAPFISQTARGVDHRAEGDIPTHTEAFALIVDALTHPEHGAIPDLGSIDAVGHRVVHGGDTLLESTIVTPEVVAELERCISLAPLHTPAHLIGIRESGAVLPDVPHVLVFDTAFHRTMPPRAAYYALPYEMIAEHKIRKYGFHGSSFRYVSKRTAELLDRPIEDLKMVVCHLGNGSSMAAIDGGIGIDTTMGLTPLEGLMMGTRTGDIDPAVVLFLIRELGMDADSVDHLLNKRSGLLGVSGRSQDLRDIVAGAEEGDERCNLALDMFAYRVRKYIGAYAAAMDGLDVIVFTAGIGANAPVTRSLVADGLTFLGVELDFEANFEGRGERIISTPDSKVVVAVVPTDEEHVIVEDTVRLAREAADAAAR